MAIARYFCFLCCYVLFSSNIQDIFAVLRPRGVPLSHKIFYDPHAKFNCLDGSGTFPFHFVNDDFCDCIDGSDEPGTSACPEGKFTCCNYGHLPLLLPSSRVNDGICDCCDTSDEFNSTADCLNNCKELGLKAFYSAKSVLELYKAGNETRQLFIAEAKEKKDEYQKRLNELLEKEQELLKRTIRMQELKEKAEDKERVFLGIQKQIKQEQEKRRKKEMKLLQEKRLQDEVEAKKAFEKLDKNKDGKVTLTEVKSFMKFDYDGDGKVSDQEAQFYMHKKEELNLDEFLSNGWRVMKTAFIVEEPMPPEGKRINPVVEPHETIGRTEQDLVKKLSAVDEKEKNAAFEDAAIKRKEFADSNKALQDVQEDIWKFDKKISMNYGAEDEFLALETKCFDFIDKRYLYRFCPFDKALQISRHNQDETLLGLWENWCGADDQLFSKMNFTRGSTCWNGPPRSVIVSLSCGLENKMLSVTEASPCVYEFSFETPASCKDFPPDIESILASQVISL